MVVICMVVKSAYVKVTNSSDICACSILVMFGMDQYNA